MDGRGQPNFSEYFFLMFLPESWGFGMTLHGRKNWDYMTGWNRWQMLMLDPPFIERTIWANEESFALEVGLQQTH